MKRYSRGGGLTRPNPAPPPPAPLPPPVPVTLPSLAINPTSVRVTEGNESHKQIEFNVSLNVSNTLVSVNYSTRNGTATADRDYMAQKGALVFSPGQQTQTIRINVTGDVSNEMNETFSIVLSGPVNAVISRGTSRITIIDDDVGICGRTQHVQNSILGQIAGVSNCADVTSERLAQISSLYLRGYRYHLGDYPLLNSLKAGDLDGLTSLWSLSLAYANLSSLPQGIFDDLHNLSTLRLGSNRLSSLPQGVFDNNPELRYLYLL